MLRSLSPEARLILASASSDAAADESVRAALREPLDWRKVLWLAEAERAVSILWQRLHALGNPGVPQAAADGLRKHAMVAEFKLAYLKQRLDASLDALSAAGVEVLLLKGAALAHTVYSSFSQRPMGDLDLLVAEGYAAEALHVLLGAGWTRALDAPEDVAYREHHHLPPLDDARGTGVSLEIHTALFARGDPFHLSPEVLLRHAERRTVGGRTVLVPSTHHQLLHLCLHFAWSHMLRFGAWRTLRDLEAIVRSGGGGVRWEAFVADARAARASTCCYWTFRLGRHLLGTEVPAEVVAALKPPASEAVLARLERHFALHLFPSERLCPSERLGDIMWRLGVRPEWSGHGAVRPWDHAPDFVPRGAVPVAGSRKVVHHLRHARRWTRYVWTILLPAPSAKF